jgi:signal transduction histidine kinase
MVESQHGEEAPVCALGGPWSLDLRSWQFTWSAEARLIHEVEPSFAPTLWQALGFVDHQDLAQLLADAAATLRSGAPFDREVGIVTARRRCKRVQVTGWVVNDNGMVPRILEGVIREVPAAGSQQAVGEQEELAHLRAALRDWEAFARSIPHELKAPLGIVEAFAAIVYEREGAMLSERGREQVQRIRATAAHARSLGEALLVLAPLSLQPMRWETVDLSALAWQFIDVMRSVDKHRTVEVTVQPGMAASGDPDLLRALVGNLLGNAWKFTTPRAVARIEFRSVTQGGASAFCIADNGVGFDMQYAHKLFAPFERLHGPAEFGGNGIGLAIAHRVVQRHRGRIWVEAREAEGARFFFSLG